MAPNILLDVPKHRGRTASKCSSTGTKNFRTAVDSIRGSSRRASPREMAIQDAFSKLAAKRRRKNLRVVGR
jgi:hypothetical protein